MDCQYSSCYLLVQPLFTSLATSSYVLRAGLCPAGGCEKPCLADWSVVSFPSAPLCPVTRISWILLCSSSFTSDWWQSQTNSELSGAYQGPWRLLSFWKECRCSYLCNPFYLLHYASLNGIYFSLEYCGVEPKAEAMLSSQAPSIHPSTSAFIGLCTRWGPLRYPV